MRPDRDNDVSRWTLYGWALVLLYALFQALQWPLLPRFLDIYYHLGVMKGFADAGGYVTTAYWEYAPAGRPHLYPPLLHIWMWMVYKLGLDAITVGRLVDCVSFPALLGIWYFTTSRLFGPRAAFWALLLFSSVSSVALASVTLSAFNLAFLLGLLALLEAEQDRPRRAGLLLALCFYTHTLAAVLMLLTMALNACLERGKRRTYLQSAALGAVLALPFLAYQLHFRAHFGFVNVRENNVWEPDLLIFALLVPALAAYPSLRKTTNRPATKTSAGWRWALALTLGMAPLIATHQTRFFSGHGLAGASLLAALFVDDRLRRFNRAGMRRAAPLVLVSLAAFTIFLAPCLEWDLKTGRKAISWADRTLTRYLWTDPSRNFRSNAFTIYFQEPYEEIASVIRAHSEPDDILWTDFSYTAGIFGMMAGRATSCAMLAEMKPFEHGADRLSDARILVWFRDRQGKAVPGMWPSAERRGLKLLKETDMVYVFQNPEGFRKRQVPAPLLPSLWLWPLGLGSLLIVLSVFSPSRGQMLKYD